MYPICVSSYFVVSFDKSIGLCSFPCIQISVQVFLSSVAQEIGPVYVSIAFTGEAGFAKRVLSNSGSGSSKIGSE